MNGHASAIRPVLPDPDREWPVFNDPGRNRIDPQNIESILMPHDGLDPTGIPAIYARQFMFQWALRLPVTKPEHIAARTQLETLVRAAFLGVLDVTEIPIGRLGVFGELIGQDPRRRGKTHLVLYSWDRRVVAVADDPTFLFPTPNLEARDIADIDAAVVKLLDDYKHRTDAHEHQNLETRAAWIFDEWARAMAQSVLVEDVNALRIVSELARNWVESRTIIPPANPDLLRSTPPGSRIPQFIGHIFYCPKCVKNLLDIQHTEAPVIHGAAPSVPCVCGSRHAWESVLPGGLALLERNGRKEFLIWNDPDWRPPHFVRVAPDPGQQQVAYHIGKFVVIVRGRILKPEDTLVPHVVRLGPPGRTRLPDLPFYREYLPIVESSECTQPTGSTAAYRFRLKGMTGDKRVTLPVKGDDGYNVRLTLWPRFRVEGWNLHYALFTQTALHENHPRIWLVGEDRATTTFVSDLPTDERTTGQMHSAPARRMGFIPSYFGMEWRPDRNDVQDAETGYFRIPDSYVPEIKKIPGALRRIAVDFGTSNTYVAVDSTKETTPGYLELSYDAFTGESLDADETARAVVESTRRWLCLTRFRPAPQTFPSELVFHRPTIQLPDLDRPLDAFTIRNPRIAYLLPQQDAGDESFTATEADKAVRRRYVTNFKWTMENELFGWDSARARFIVQYLTGILELVVASLVARDHCESVSAVVTFPLAFDESMRAEYVKAWDDIQKEISDVTGISLTRADMIDESRAGALGSAGSEDDSRHVVIDVGGGTTDIAFFLNPDKLFFIDSLRFGGDDLVEILADKHAMPAAAQSRWNTIRRHLDGVVKDNEHDDNRIDQMLRMALTREWIQSGAPWVKNLPDKSARDILEQAIYHFFNGILEYVTSLIRAWDTFDGGQHAKKIHVHALGNGWRMWRGLSSLDTIYPDIQSNLNARMDGGRTYDIEVSGPTDRTLNTKATTAIGALRALQTGANRRMNPQWPLSPRSGVCSVIGLPVRIADRDLHENDRVPAVIETSAPTVTVDAAVLRERFRNCEEFLHIDERMAQQFGSDIPVFFDNSVHGKTTLFESPLKIFLTRYYLPHLKWHYSSIARDRALSGTK
ncbi:MAG: hypothetical protein IT350_07960 [Deltaproteobacteria bacterium]|nr:hypothetical protein [Deltaproteobacteria bacterium]